MSKKRLPRYSVYVISKGRFENCLTAKMLVKEGVPFTLVVEPQEYEDYRAAFPKVCIAVLPFSNLGLGSVPARNWVWEDALGKVHERHWILDDNIRSVYRRYKAKRIRCDSGVALAVVEEFTDRYDNIAISGLQYKMFAPETNRMAPFYLNNHVYSCLLINNKLPYRWRGRYNEDTDLCLQVLSGGWCTVLVNAFLIDKMRTMTMKGGNTEELYGADGRLKMARSLERLWPGIVTTGRRYGRPQHYVRDGWKRFKTPLKLKRRVNLGGKGTKEYGMKLVQVAPEIKSKELKELVYGLS